jgi:hypothetical protein
LVSKLFLKSIVSLPNLKTLGAFVFQFSNLSPQAAPQTLSPSFILFRLQNFRNSEE